MARTSAVFDMRRCFQRDIPSLLACRLATSIATCLQGGGRGVTTTRTPDCQWAWRQCLSVRPSPTGRPGPLRAASRHPLLSATKKHEQVNWACNGKQGWLSPAGRFRLLSVQPGSGPPHRRRRHALPAPQFRVAKQDTTTFSRAYHNAAGRVVTLPGPFLRLPDEERPRLHCPKQLSPPSQALSTTCGTLSGAASPSPSASAPPTCEPLLARPAARASATR